MAIVKTANCKTCKKQYHIYSSDIETGSYFWDFCGMGCFLKFWEDKVLPTADSMGINRVNLINLLTSFQFSELHLEYFLDALRDTPGYAHKILVDSVDKI